MSNLLSVIVNQNGYEYDIHSLVKAFYPAQDVKVFVPDSDEKDIVSSDEGLPDLKIDFEPEMIRMSIVDGGRGRTDFGGYKVELEDGMDRPHIKNCLKKLHLHSTFRAYRQAASLGNPDRNPPDENSDDDDGRGHYG